MTAYKLSTFKKLDAYAQLFLLAGVLGWGIFTLATKGTSDADHLLYAYFVVGASQFLSFMINWLGLGLGQSFGRKLYAKALLVMVITLIPPITIIGMFLFLAASPVLAIAYIIICFKEIKPRPFFDL